MISAMILNVNGLNIPIKRQRMKEWMKKKIFVLRRAPPRKCKDNPQNGRKYLQITWGKGLVSKMCNNKRQNNYKWTKDLNRYFSEEDMQEAKSPRKDAPQYRPSGKCKPNHKSTRMGTVQKMGDSKCC